MPGIIKDCTGVILAGGENRRMPVLKGFIEVEGRKIVERNVKVLRQLFNEVLIVTNQPELYIHLNVPLLGDVYNTRGPMTGVFTALINSASQWVFVSACDMPFINPKLIEYMSAKRDGVDVVVPVLENRAEPLFAFYSKRVLTSLEQFILSGKKGIKYFLLEQNNRVQYVTAEEIKGLDPELKSFVNLNSPKDVEQYLQPQDRLKFKNSVMRRKQCSDLAQQS